MTPTIAMPALDIHYVTDTQGQRIFVQIPVAQWERLQSRLTVLEEQPEPSESPEILNEGGLLVVNATPLHDLSLVVEEARNQRMAELIQRIGL